MHGQKNAKNFFVLSVCLLVRMEQLGSHRTHFRSFLQLGFFFEKSVQKFQVSLKSYKNNGCFTWRSRGVTLTPHPLLVLWSRKSGAIPLLPLWVVRPVQRLGACTRVHTLYMKVYVHL